METISKKSIVDNLMNNGYIFNARCNTNNYSSFATTLNTPLKNKSNALIYIPSDHNKIYNNYIGILNEHHNNDYPNNNDSDNDFNLYEFVNANKNTSSRKLFLESDDLTLCNFCLETDKQKDKIHIIGIEEEKPEKKEQLLETQPAQIKFAPIQRGRFSVMKEQV
jgi:hypothetical protein